MPDSWGSHNMKAGGEFSYTGNRNRNQGNLNGTYIFSHNLKFDPNNPFTYPERFSIRVPGDSDFTAIRRAYAAYIQDKWTVTPNLTLNLGLRYSYEDVPVSNFWNPKFPNGGYPKDKNDFGPRAGFNYAIGSARTSTIRGSWGLFHQSSPFNTVNNYTRTGVYTNSFTVNFPQTAPDPGPASGNFPTDPMLAWVRTNGLASINRALVEALYPQGTMTKNSGTVSWDDPERRNPYNHQVTFGVQHQFTTNFAVTMDYQRTMSRDFIVLQDLNPGVRATTSRTAQVIRPDPTITSLLTPIHAGYQNWNALLVSVDKRFSQRYSWRVAYTLAKGTGNVTGNSATTVSQVGTNLNLDQNFGPNPNDRRHILALSGVFDVPYTGGMRLSTITRIQSGTPFSLTDDSLDLDRNGLVNEYLPAGTYTGVAPTIGGVVREDLATTVDYKGGRNGAYGPGRFQMDIRAGYRFNVGESKILDVYAELLNATDTPSLSNPGTNRRLPASFLVFNGQQNLAASIQFGARYGF
jgi:outer membrane receptor protein involved in Fe transport